MSEIVRVMRKTAQDRRHVAAVQEDIPVSSKKRKRDDSPFEEAKEAEKKTREDSHTIKSSTENLCLCQSDPKIPRPRNAFILYRQHHQASLVARYPGLSNPEISKLLGEEWKNSPVETKDEWKRHAEAEKERHMRQHPGYKYQPRRSFQRHLDVESAGNIGTINCQKCGGRSMLGPVIPMSAERDTCKSSLTKVGNSSKEKGIAKFSPIIQNPSILLKRQHSPFSRPTSIAIPNQGQPQPRQGGSPPEVKKRRFNDESSSASFMLPTPYRTSFSGRQGPDQARQWGPLSAGSVTAPSSISKLNKESPDYTLKSSDTIPQPQNVEQYIASIPVLLKVYQLRRVAPAYRASKSLQKRPATRGAIIAIEGDDQIMVREIAHWLEDYLVRLGTYHVKGAQGPTGPRTDEVASISDYLKVIADWQAKSNEMIAFITHQGSWDGRGDDEEVPPDAPDPTSPTPIILLQRFQLFATNSYACRIPIQDTYKPLEHWQWMASLWRGIVGPDVTICIKDVRPEELRKDSRLVEVQEELGVVIVKRGGAGGELPPQMRLDDSVLRRLGFEISELVRNVGVPPSE